MRFGVWGLEFGVWGLGFGLRFKIGDLGFWESGTSVLQMFLVRPMILERGLGRCVFLLASDPANLGGSPHSMSMLIHTKIDK